MPRVSKRFGDPSPYYMSTWIALGAISINHTEPYTLVVGHVPDLRRYGLPLSAAWMCSESLQREVVVNLVQKAFQGGVGGYGFGLGGIVGTWRCS